MAPASTPTRRRRAEGSGQDDRLNWAHFREAALGGKDARAVERELVAKLEKEFPEQRRMFRRIEAGQAQAVARLARDARLRQWIHCGPGYPMTAAAEDTHELVLPRHPRRKVLYVTDDQVIAAHSRALRKVGEPDQIRVISADLGQPEEIRRHPEIDGWLDWSQPIVLLHGDAWIHYAGTGEQAAGIMQRWVDQLVNGSYTVSTHLLRPDDETASRRAAVLTERLEGTPVDTLQFRTREEIAALFPKQEMPAGLSHDLDTRLRRGPSVQSMLDAWVVDGVGHVTESVAPEPASHWIGTDEASRITGYTKRQLASLARKGLVPSSRDPRGRYEFDPDELLELVASWKQLAAQNLKPPAPLPQPAPAPTVDRA
ncbi:SAM-dependent methyltransferase [Kribbella sp. NPDC048928]|uniref:SAM-dependent methyltransferase n=1 Tax=Kribbella sp. NPDC048928 TaxID=3364111 RepID=UPI003716452C